MTVILHHASLTHAELLQHVPIERTLPGAWPHVVTGSPTTKRRHFFLPALIEEIKATNTSFAICQGNWRGTSWQSMFHVVTMTTFAGKFGSKDIRGPIAWVVDRCKWHVWFFFCHFNW